MWSVDLPLRYWTLCTVAVRSDTVWTSVAGIGLSVLWLYGLTLCGPLRTILLYGQVDAVPVAMLVTIFSGE